MTSPLFTVLMPTHNRGDVIGRAIESVIRQTLSDFELIIVGDGCTDDTAAVVSRYRDPRIKWMDLPKAPSFGYANRNIAMALARGRHVAYCAHDDLLFPDHLEHMASALEGAATPWAYSQPLWVSSDGIMSPIPGDLRNPVIAQDYQRRNFIPMSNVAHTRALYDATGGWAEDAPIAADWLLWKEMIAQVGSSGVRYLHTPTMLHFKAIWKTRRDSGLPEFGAALTVADASSWWPTVLRLRRTDEETLQDAAARLMAQRQYPSHVREGCAAVLDQLATEMLRDLLPGILSTIRSVRPEGPREGRDAGAPPLVKELLFYLMLLLSALDREARAPATARGALNTALPDDADETTLIQRSGLFDEAWYLEQYPDIRAAGVDPLAHFQAHGWRERRRPSRYFDTALYLESHANLLDEGVNPLVHHLRSGR